MLCVRHALTFNYSIQNRSEICVPSNALSHVKGIFKICSIKMTLTVLLLNGINAIIQYNAKK